MEIERVGVIGAGTMGNGIAHVFARSGYRVTLCDVEQRFLDRGLETIGKNLDREVAKNKITAEDKAATVKRIEPVVGRTQLAGWTKRPDKVIGMHFFNPVPVMKLVEVIRGLATSNEPFETVRELAVKLGKTPVEVNDAPGFVSNRVLMPLLNEAMYAVMEGVATPEAV